ncbi:hypothetical protein YC2023_084036 [Brassica napus]
MGPLPGQSWSGVVNPGAAWHPDSDASSCPIVGPWGLHHYRRRQWWWWRILARPRWYGGVPRPCCGFTVGQLSPISFSVPLQFCQECCIHCVWSLCWVLVHWCSHTLTFCLAGGLSRRPGDPSCRSLGGRGCPCNFGVLGRHPVDKRRDI